MVVLVRQRKLPFSVTVMRKAKEQLRGLRAANDHAERVLLLLLLRVIQCQVLLAAS